MNILVHLMLARNVQMAVRERTGAKMNGLGFLLGNILPDISSRYDVHPHFQAASLHFVLECVDSLCDKAKEKRRDSFTFAKEIGVVTHYLSDFCCHAHSAQFRGGILRHHWYEWTMLSDFAEGSGQFGDCPTEMADAPELFRVFLKGILRQYQKALPGGATDVYYALRVSAVMAMLPLSRAADPGTVRYARTDGTYALQQAEGKWNESRLFL